VRHVRMLGLCLVAAFALAAVAASSAVAGPQWIKCELAGPGHNYSGPNCTKEEKAKPKGTGEYELYKGPEIEAKRVAEGKSAGVPFSGHSVGAGGTLTTVFRECGVEENSRFITTTRQGCIEEGGEERSDPTKFFVECSNETNVGEAVSKNQVGNVHVTFTGCTLLEAYACNSSGKAEGEIETSPLKGKLGWINKSAKEVGVLLEPAAGKHAAFAEFVCGGILATDVGVGNKKEGAEYTSSGCYGICPGTTPEEEKHGGYDGIISPITPVNQMTNEFTQVYTQEAAYPYRNIPSAFEGKHISVLEDKLFGVEEPNIALDWSAAGEVITNVNTPEEESEIKA
jgi:hypothetical protein